MAENLKTGYVPITTAQTNNAVIETYCQNLSGVNDATCPLGGLYEWEEVVQYLNGASNTTSPSPAFSGNVQGVCMTGWHLPTDAEWIVLEEFQGMCTGAGAGCSGAPGWRGTDEGGKLKQTGTSNWTTPNTGATNTSGFTALPGGASWSGSFYVVGYYGYWWSTDESSTTYAWRRLLYYNTAQVYRSSNNKAIGFSVRCVKD